MTNTYLYRSHLLYGEYLAARRARERELLKPDLPPDEVDEEPQLNDDWGLEDLTVAVPLSCEFVTL